MFIGNATKQIQDFVYRLAENPSTMRQTIPIGGQVQISGDLNMPQIDTIIAQHARYGMRKSDELDRTKPFVGLLYSIDRPIPAMRLTQAMEHNDNVLTQRGEETREQIAVASSNAIENKLEDDRNNGMPDVTLREFETQIIEEEKPGQVRVDGQKTIAEGVRVNRNQDGRGAPGKGRGKRKP